MLNLVVVELFRTPAKPVALKTSDQQLQPFDLRQRRAQDEL
jgi:hypothetical protein